MSAMILAQIHKKLSTSGASANQVSLLLKQQRDHAMTHNAQSLWTVDKKPIAFRQKQN